VVGGTPADGQQVIMALFEYTCGKCGSTFEKIVRPSSTRKAQRIICPSCGSVKVKRHLSRVSAARGGESGGASSDAGASCSTGFG
jgi:putative FmdB family regulatory protein